MAECAIHLERLSSAYGTTRVCDEISLRIRRGAKVVLVGSNGAGKSSLLNILAGKRRPVGGSALVLGEDAFECTALVQRIALVTSEWMECVPGTNLPVKTLVASAAVGVAPERVAELVEVLGAHALLRSHVNSLSEGQRRCVHLLCKLLPPRDLLLFDEATSSLDPKPKPKPKPRPKPKPKPRPKPKPKPKPKPRPKPKPKPNPSTGF
jgi:ABC-type multidrug transport system ATPase subunit